MTATAELLDELRLLRAMGEGGRKAAAAALRSARLAAPQADPMKFLTHALDAAIVDRGGGTIFAPKPHGELSPEADRRLAAWAFETPRRHANAPGTPPTKDEPEGFVGPRQRPGRLVGGMTGKLGGFASDLDEVGDA